MYGTSFTPPAAVLRAEVDRIRDGDRDIAGLELTGDPRWVTLQVLRWNQVVAITTDYYLIAPDLESRVVLRTVGEGDPLYDQPVEAASPEYRAIEELGQLSAFIPVHFARFTADGMSSQTRLIVQGYAVRVDPGKLWDSALRANDDFFEYCHSLEFRTDAYVKCEAMWRDGEHKFGTPLEEPTPPLGWEQLGVEVSRQPHEPADENLGQPVGQIAVESGTVSDSEQEYPKESLSPSRQWIPECDAIRDDWFRQMKAAKKWIARKKAIREFLEKKQPRNQPPERWPEKWRKHTTESIYLRFKNNESEWKQTAEQLKAEFGS